MNKKTDKFIDLKQLPMDKNGRILWTKSIGKTIDFYYYNKRHTVKILNYGNPDRDHIEISIDDMPSKIVNTQKIRNLQFDDLFAKPDYLYDVDEIVNGSIILEQLHIQRNNKGYRVKHYKCRCLTDGYEYIITEKELKKGRKCPKCVGKVLIIGHNDLATTDPDIIKYLSDKEDGYKYTRCSHKYIKVVCPICGYEKSIRVEELVLNGGFSCPRCSDGLSYPNKFSYNVFEQISKQYKNYISEYSPDWAGQMRYDNYILLKDGQEIVVEMDGGFHYNEYGKWAAQNDAIKDALAEEHGIKVIRINCFYNKITERFDLVKNGLINNLREYFDLSCVDWDSANESGISSRLVEAINYYNEHPFITNQQIADHFHVNVVTIRHYLTVGEEIGLCTYIRHDPNRLRVSIPLVLYDSNHVMIGVYMSAKHMAEAMADKGFCSESINESSRLKKPYKGYFIGRITWEEYEQYQNLA